MNKHLLSSIVILSIALGSCSRFKQFENAATVHYDSEKMQKHARYFVQGKRLYTTYCSNCHQEAGDGLGQLIPPLAQSDYLLADIPRSICIIKKGIEGEIIVNGKTYNQAMPALSRLTNLEIAEISTYILNSWGNEKGMVDIKAVDEALSNCQ